MAGRGDYFDIGANQTKNQSKQPLSISWPFSIKFLLIILYISRLIIGIFSKSYIHPDEHHQNPEVMAKIIWNIKAELPWEFKEFSIRSPIWPWLTNGWWMYLIGLDEIKRIAPTGWMVNALSRGTTILLSFIVDWSIYEIIKFQQQKSLRNSLKNNEKFEAWIPSILVASSWPLLVIGTRPFSNSHELILFSLLCGICFRNIGKFQNSLTQGLIIGIIHGLGIWCRFTFPIFTGPILIWYLTKHTFKHSFLISLFSALFLVISIFCLIFIDSLFYGSISISIDGESTSIESWNKILELGVWDIWNRISIVGNPTITPLNGFIYNSNSKNLALHGLHPRYLHLIVNIPMLFGPLLFRMKYNSPWSICGWISLSLLSLAPHQEARFLIPLLITFVLSQNLRKPSHKWWLLWFTFNLALILFFGGLHQSSLTDALVWVRENHNISNKYDCNQSIIYVSHTYSPPEWVTLQEDVDSCNRLKVMNTKGTEMKTVLNQIKKELKSNRGKIMLLCPTSACSIEIISNEFSQYNIIKRFWPNLTTEDLPKSFSDLYLLLIEFNSETETILTPKTFSNSDVNLNRINDMNDLDEKIKNIKNLGSRSTIGSNYNFDKKLGRKKKLSKRTKASSRNMNYVNIKDEL